MKEACSDMSGWPPGWWGGWKLHTGKKRNAPH